MMISNLAKYKKRKQIADIKDAYVVKDDILYQFPTSLCLHILLSTGWCSSLV